MTEELADLIIIHLLSSSIDRGIKTERTRIVMSMRKWADDMDTPEWRDGWMPEIAAARTFAAQIEDGTL